MRNARKAVGPVAEDLTGRRRGRVFQPIPVELINRKCSNASKLFELVNRNRSR